MIREHPYVVEGKGSGLVVSFVEKPSRSEIVQLRSNLEEEGVISALERKKAKLEEELDEASVRLREIERRSMIGEIATMVGHDLRNPFQVVINRLYLAKASARSHQDSAKELESLIEVLDRQVDYMNKIVSDLLDCGRELRPEVSMVEFKSLIFNVLSSVPDVERYSIRVLAEEGIRVPVDVELMSRVLTNLANNAIQAMPGGGSIEFSVEAIGGTFVIKVRDSGPGISPDNLGKVFIPFFTTKAKGMGLGLVAVKRIVEAHGGNISVESRPGEGTTFFIKIPDRRIA